MRFGVVILPEAPWREAREVWVRADEFGFDHAWTYDHLAWRTLADRPWFAAIPTLTAAALATNRIRLGTFVASPNYRHPVPFAKELVTLEDISDGRLNIGIGAGGIGFDATVLGADVLTPKQRADRLIEFVTLLDATLRSDHSSYSGEYFTALDARTVPMPSQQPRIPFVIAANGPRMLRLAAEYGQGWVTTGATEPEAGLAAWWEGVRQLSTRFDEAAEQAGRGSAAVAKYLSIDACGQVALTSLEYFRDCVGQASEAGFTDLVLHWPRSEGIYAASETTLEAVVGEYLVAQ